MRFMCICCLFKCKCLLFKSYESSSSQKSRSLCLRSRPNRIHLSLVELLFTVLSTAGSITSFQAIQLLQALFESKLLRESEVIHYFVVPTTIYRMILILIYFPTKITFFTTKSVDCDIKFSSVFENWLTWFWLSAIVYFFI